MHRTAVSVLLAFQDGGAFAKRVRFKEISNAEFPVAENEANKIMHIALPVGKTNVLIANDVSGSMGRTNEHGNRSKISISAESRKEADKLFNGLSAGGDIEGQIGDSPWSSYTGMFRDKMALNGSSNSTQNKTGESNC